jgi:hypothetical protein
MAPLEDMNCNAIGHMAKTYQCEKYWLFPDFQVMFKGGF